MKKDEFTIWDYLHAFFWVVLIVTLVVPVYAAIANPPSRSLTTWILIAFFVLDLTIAILYFVLTIPTDKRIISKLQKAGYECGMQEGKIYFKRRECNWRIFISDVSKHYRKVLFCLSFIDEDLDKDHALINKIVCIVGDRNYTVMTNWSGTDGVRFLYATVFTSTKDILREFSFATEAIDTAASEFFSLKKKFSMEDSLPDDHKVGFHFGEKTDSEAQEVRAQNEKNI